MYRVVMLLTGDVEIFDYNELVFALVDWYKDTETAEFLAHLLKRLANFYEDKHDIFVKDELYIEKIAE